MSNGTCPLLRGMEYIIIIIIIMPLARISLTLSRHFSLSFIASGRSSGLHPVSSHSCCMYVRAGRPAFAWPYAGVYRSTSLMSSSLLLQQCPACLVRLTWIVFVMGGRWPYSWCLVGCCRQDLFNVARKMEYITLLKVLSNAYICLCLSPDRTWHEVNDQKVDYSGGLGEGKVGHEPCLTMLVIGPLSAMWA